MTTVSRFGQGCASQQTGSGSTKLDYRPVQVLKFRVDSVALDCKSLNKIGKGHFTDVVGMGKEERTRHRIQNF